MSRQRKNGAWYRQPINASNIAEVQKKFEDEIKIHDKSKTVLNGTIKASEQSEDLEYKFLYSVSELEDGDNYTYEFETFPSDTLADIDKVSMNKTGFSKVGRVRSRSTVTPMTVSGGDALPKRPFSASCGKRINKPSRKVSMASNVTDLVNGRQDRLVSGDDESGTYKRRESTLSKGSSLHTGISDVERRISQTSQKKKSVSYDPALDKASAFIHGGGKNFSRANTSLMPMKYGMKHLQMSYTETNLETNQSVIFLDLLKNSYHRSQVRNAYIQHIERRLANKRNDPLRSTSFYENKKIPDPFRRDIKKTARTAAQKKIERKKKIKQTTDEIHTGYVPTRLTMKIADHKEVEEIGKRCRYLRYSPTPHLADEESTF